MKKSLLVVLFALVLVVTGCGNKNKVVCSKTSTQGEDTVKEEGVFYFGKDGKVESAEGTYTFNNKDMAKQYCDIIKVFIGEDKANSMTCTDTKITVKDLQDIQSEDDETQITTLTKDELIKYEEENGYSCK